MEYEGIKTPKRHAEKGNVLFLILIAVALFAALSYAVTSSSRSGGGDVNKESNLVKSSQITQYPASVRTSIIRMIVSSGVSVDELEFNRPSQFGNCLTGFEDCVFHPSGGNATFVPAPADVVTGSTPQAWVFNGENEINLVGTTTGGDAPTSSTADIIAFLPNVQKAICEKINDELGIAGGTVPIESNLDVTTEMINTTGAAGGKVGLVSAASGGTIGGDVTTLDSQAFGCFQMPANTYYYYHVLIEQ